MTDEHKRKIGEANKISKLGSKLSKEHKLNISKALIGKSVPSRGRKGRKWTKEMKDNLSRIVKERYDKIGRKTEITKLIRSSSKSKQWRLDIFERDDYICQFCFKRGGDLNADHITPLHKILKENKITTTDEGEKCEELWDIENGRTLCVPCHRTTDTYARPKEVVVK